MRTARSLTASHSIRRGGHACPGRGACLGDMHAQGVCVPRGVRACENITFPKLLLRAVKIAGQAIQKL